MRSTLAGKQRKTTKTANLNTVKRVHFHIETISHTIIQKYRVSTIFYDFERNLFCSHLFDQKYSK